MSNTSMLEQAIVDAEALKETALKSAESTILEKYSREVEKAVNSLLEQEEPMVAPPVPMPIPGEETLGEPGEQFENIPRAHYQEDAIGEDQEVDIDLDRLAEELEKEFGGETEEDPTGVDSKEEAEDLAATAIMAVHNLAVGSGADISTTVNTGEEAAAEDEDMAFEPVEDTDEDEDEAVELTEEQLASLIEKITGIPRNVPTGQPGGGSNETLDEENEEIAIAHEAQMAAEEKEKKKMKESIKKLQKDKKELFEQNKKFKNLLVQLKERLEEVNLSNAKLLYTNRVLGSTSLNERQKVKLVEALSKAGSVEESKVIYETLQSAVGSSRKRTPQSLSEAVKRNSSTTIPHRKEEKKSNPHSDRWKTLAGIK